jgi:hypothetical protein
MTFDNIWNDPVWSKVIGGLIVVILTAIAGGISKLSGWPKRFWDPALRKTHAYVSDQSQSGASYRLKYYLELVNDSKKCVAVTVSEFGPNTVTLQKFVPNTLQLMIDGNWLPTPNSTEAVALLPRQRCRVWIGIDSAKFTAPQVEGLAARLGTLILTENGKKVPFAL